MEDRLCPGGRQAAASTTASSGLVSAPGVKFQSTNLTFSEANCRVSSRLAVLPRIPASSTNPSTSTPCAQGSTETCWWKVSTEMAKLARIVGNNNRRPRPTTALPTEIGDFAPLDGRILIRALDKLEQRERRLYGQRAGRQALTLSRRLSANVSCLREAMRRQHEVMSRIPRNMTAVAECATQEDQALKAIASDLSWLVTSLS